MYIYVVPLNYLFTSCIRRSSREYARTTWIGSFRSQGSVNIAQTWRENYGCRYITFTVNANFTIEKYSCQLLVLLITVPFPIFIHYARVIQLYASIRSEYIDKRRWWRVITVAPNGNCLLLNNVNFDGSEQLQEKSQICGYRLCRKYLTINVCAENGARYICQ